MHREEKRDYREMYEKNKDFREYVDRFCLNKPFMPEDALEMRHIKDYADWLIEKGETL